MKHFLCASLLSVAAFSCGELPSSRAPSASAALTGTAESLEFEPVGVRQELFREVSRLSQSQAGHAGAVVFPMMAGEEFIAAPALDVHADLLAATDAGGAVLLAFDRTEPFAEDRRDAFQGLSEREAAEQIARSLLQAWNLKPSGTVTVKRVAGAPYAAAWIDGELRLNPSFIYLAAAPAVP